MRYWMYQIDNKNKGDSGGMSLAITVAADGTQTVEDDATPKVGVYMRVGSLYARSFQSQDWWQTNIITEIIEDTTNYVKFKTASGSIYEWKC